MPNHDVVRLIVRRWAALNFTTRKTTNETQHELSAVRLGLRKSDVSERRRIGSFSKVEVGSPLRNANRCARIDGTRKPDPFCIGVGLAVQGSEAQARCDSLHWHCFC